MTEMEDMGFFGLPEAAYRFVYDALYLVTAKPPESVRTPLEYQGWLRVKQERVEKLFKTDGSQWFFLYWADNEGFTDHDGDISDCWLTPHGEALLVELGEYLFAIEHEAIKAAEEKAAKAAEK